MAVTLIICGTSILITSIIAGVVFLGFKLVNEPSSENSEDDCLHLKEEMEAVIQRLDGYEKLVEDFKDVQSKANNFSVGKAFTSKKRG